MDLRGLIQAWQYVMKIQGIEVQDLQASLAFCRVDGLAAAVGLR